jgi:hypothetical protein
VLVKVWGELCESGMAQQAAGSLLCRASSDVRRPPAAERWCRMHERHCGRLKPLPAATVHLESCRSWVARQIGGASAGAGPGGLIALLAQICCPGAAPSPAPPEGGGHRHAPSWHQGSDYKCWARQGRRWRAGRGLSGWFGEESEKVSGGMVRSMPGGKQQPCALRGCPGHGTGCSAASGPKRVIISRCLNRGAAPESASGSKLSKAAGGRRPPPPRLQGGRLLGDRAGPAGVGAAPCG